MRILAAIQHRGLRGGAETYLGAVLPRLAQRGHQLGLLYGEPAPRGAPLVDGGLDAPAFEARSAAEALQAAAQFKPDVIFSNGLTDLGAERALLREHRVAFFAHGFHGICISGHKRFLTPKLEPCTRAFGPACLAHYLPRGCGGRNPITAVQLYRLQRARLAGLATARALIVGSHYLRDAYAKNGIPAERITVAPLFPARLQPQAAPPAKSAPQGRILFLGRLDGFKGCQLLLEAVCQLDRLAPELRAAVTIAGDGPLRGSLEAQATRLGLRVTFLGAIPLERRGEVFSQADVLAVPSIGPEPFGLVGVEAGCFGVPAVAFDAGGVRDWLTPGRNGALAAEHTPLRLAEALREVLGDPAHHARLRVGAWEGARRFDGDVHVSQLERVFDGARR